jgi:hypothetical protein
MLPPFDIADDIRLQHKVRVVSLPGPVMSHRDREEAQDLRHELVSLDEGELTSSLSSRTCKVRGRKYCTHVLADACPGPSAKHEHRSLHFAIPFFAHQPSLGSELVGVISVNASVVLRHHGAHANLRLVSEQ